MTCESPGSRGNRLARRGNSPGSRGIRLAHLNRLIELARETPTSGRHRGTRMRPDRSGESERPESSLQPLVADDTSDVSVTSSPLRSPIRPFSDPRNRSTSAFHSQIIQELKENRRRIEGGSNEDRRGIEGGSKADRRRIEGRLKED